tara:strand:- start:4669 stop:5253 length:585 start_codon:yes stop_codon:yes gene_type:complete
MIQLNKAYWNFRYDQQRTGWDTGSITTPLKEYFDQLTDRDLRILIPGAGNAYEAEYLISKGFKNVDVLDISDRAISLFKSRVPDFPNDHIYNENFFDHRNTYDIIIEQTFFCALDPTFRKAYSKKCDDLLRPSGKVVGLLWNHEFGNPEPPFGGSMAEYLELFSVHFKVDILDLAYNSIKPRSGRELFIKLIKK